MSQTEIALLNLSKAWSPRDLAFVARAVEIQLERDFLPLWKDAILAFGDTIMPVVAYSSLDGLPAGSFAPISILDDIGEPGALGFHDWELEAWGRSQPNTVTVPHEVLEMEADRKCNRWVTMPNGSQLAMEVGDPVEDQTYNIDVELDGEKRSIKVTNFVMPRYFEMAFGDLTKGYDFLGNVSKPFENQGYQIIKAPDGTVSNVFASTDKAYRARIESKGWFSRTGRRRGLQP